MHLRLRLRLLAILLVVSAAGCGILAPTTLVGLGIANGTSLTVTLFVNGAKVADAPAGGPGPSIDAARLPPLPWHVEARSPTGRVLTSMDVAPGQVSTTTDPNGNRSSRGAMGRVDLSCGRLTIWAGDVQPSGPVPPASPGFPGDCAQ